MPGEGGYKGRRYYGSGQERVRMKEGMDGGGGSVGGGDGG